MNRRDVILEEARGCYKGRDESIRDSFAAGFLSQSVCLLEKELAEIKGELATVITQQQLMQQEFDDWLKKHFPSERTERTVA